MVKFVPETTPKHLNSFVIYFSFPALVLVNIPTLNFTSDLLITALIQWVVLFFSVGLVVSASKLFKWNRSVLGSLLLIVPLGNTSFLGFPMVQAFYGEDAIAYALIYDQLGSFLALTIYGSFILVLFSGSQEKFSIKKVLKKIVVFPPFVALIFAFALQSIALPQLYFDLLKPLAATLIPLVMIAVGFQLSLKVDLKQLNPFIIGLTIKMLLAPLIVVFIVLGFGFNGIIYQVTIFEAAMPPMITAGILAIQANLAPKLTAAMVAYGILLSFIMLPILHYLIRNI